MALPETEGAMRGWLRQAPHVSALVGQRVYFAVPEQDRPQLPFVVFYRIGGLPDSFQHDNPDFIIEAWGANKNQASIVAVAVATDIMNSNDKPPVTIDGVVVLAGTVNLGPLPSEGVSWAKRYRIDASMRMRQV